MDDAEFEEYDDLTSYETHDEPYCDPDEDTLELMEFPEDDA